MFILGPVEMKKILIPCSDFIILYLKFVLVSNQENTNVTPDNVLQYIFGIQLS